MEGFLDAFGFALAQDAVVDEDARELVADRGKSDCRCHRRIDASRQRADCLDLPDFLPHLSHCGLYDRLCVPAALAAADVEDEVGDYRLPLRRVNNFRMQLNAVAAVAVRYRREGRV